MAKAKTPTDEKFDKIDFDLFEAIAAIDKKDYDYYDRLTEEQKKKFVPYMMLMWVSTVKGSHDLQNYYLQSTDYHANKHMFNESVQKHPKLQWLMLCAASPGMGKQYHQWIPHIPAGVSKLKTLPKVKEIKDYYKKIYPKADDAALTEVSELFVAKQKRKMYLAEKFPNLKIDEIEVLNELVTDEEIRIYEEQSGNW
jgi:hypothetical protein